MRPPSRLLRPILAGALLLALGGCGDDGDQDPVVGGDQTAPTAADAGPEATLTAALRGGNAEVPEPGDPDGSGSAQVTVGAEQVCYEISVTTITLPATAAHIHRGAEGVAGPIEVTLEPPGEDGKSSGCVPADEQLLAEIGAGPNDFYVNVHTSDFPGGAVRGQLTV